MRRGMDKWSARNSKAKTLRGWTCISSTARESGEPPEKPSAVLRPEIGFGESATFQSTVGTFVGTVGANRYQPISLDELVRNSENRCATRVWSVLSDPG